MTIADAEIEIISDAKSNDLPNGNPNPSKPAEPIIVDVHSASAYGDLQKLRCFVETDGQSLSKPDGNGYYALQWAALNNYADVAQYIIEHGGDVNAADNTQQTALHWAAVRGSIAVSDVLLQSGAWIEAADLNGYRAVHVAAQYGQTAFLNHIVAKHGADFDAPDNDGRSPLHWAAYKGFADTVRLLLFWNACQGRQDKEGCTPLHWAAIRGNTEACNVLVQAGTKEELTVKDKSGFTPVQLASDRGQKHAAIILSNATRVSGIFCGYGFCNGKLAKIGYAPILLAFLVVLVVLFINSVLDAPNFTKITAVVALWGWTGVSLAVVSLFMFYRCSSKDPGYIKPRFESSLSNEGVDDALLSIDPYNSPIWTGNWSQLCPTCKIIRPLRSKHCPTCKRCVDQFDHHCPWISNCVGKKNKWDFFVFLCLGCLTSLLGAVIAVHRMWTGSPVKPSSGRWMHHMVTEHPGAVSFLLMDTILLAGASALTIAQASQIARNITTNEMANSARYSYLRGPDGRFRNPYNLGCKRNCTDFLIHGYSNDDEIAWPSLHQAVR
ncbi:probable protein S-acyltransferase 23 [Dendrobium catenatum]|uniref:S-acyltransferase n=1 Tax=Dendrobium catenatum TaxID=906689 RepID=A0A2I0XHE3_9ASPA|nr:probable protein S-acyltransferase 23 [Dendrobium catenatum]PKU87337.1 putative S-acyltransferase [Dendrobium catenatum]